MIKKNINLPSFSILMSSYNKGEYIGEAIESVLKQTYKDWELIIVDDASTDDSLKKINKYLGDKRIKFFKNDVNKGCVSTLKRMMIESRAEIIGILDSDDMLTEDALETVMSSYQKNPRYGFFYSDFIFCDEKLNFIRNGFDGYMPSDKNNIHKVYSGAFRVYIREAYLQTSGYDEKSMYIEDRDIILKLEEVTPVYHIEKILYKYRVLENSQSNNPETRIIGEINNINAKHEAYKRRIGTNIPNLTRNQMSFKLVDALFFSLKLADFKMTLGYLKKITKISPMNLIIYLWIVIRIIKFLPYRILNIIKVKKRV